MDDLIKKYEAKLSEFKKQYPKGQKVEFTFMGSQVKPSTGTILDSTIEVRHSYGKTWINRIVTIEHDQARSGSRYPCRRVAPEQIVRFI